MVYDRYKDNIYDFGVAIINILNERMDEHTAMGVASAAYKYHRKIVGNKRLYSILEQSINKIHVNGEYSKEEYDISMEPMINDLAWNIIIQGKEVYLTALSGDIEYIDKITEAVNVTDLVASSGIDYALTSRLRIVPIIKET